MSRKKRHGPPHAYRRDPWTRPFDGHVANPHDDYWRLYHMPEPALRCDRSLDPNNPDSLDKIPWARCTSSPLKTHGLPAHDVPQDLRCPEAPCRARFAEADAEAHGTKP